MIQIRQLTLYHLSMWLKKPFTSSLETFQERKFIIIEAEDKNGVTGWGEVSAFSSPWYTEETTETCYHMLKDFFIPAVLRESFAHPSQIPETLRGYKGNRMAKAGLEAAFWDIYAQINGISLSKALGGVKQEVPAGVVVGLAPLDDMLQEIDQYVKEGYQRIKLKIQPGQDIELLKEIRRHFPRVPLMADANSSYELKDISRIKELDEFKLMMIEQPLDDDDIVDHRHLQKHIKTSICLDESIRSADDARKAIELGSCKIINIKPSRVGGLTEALKIHDLCKKHNMPVWCGGMFETGISRAHNIALSSLPQFLIPGDISSSSRYWEEDIVKPEIRINNGFIKVPDRPGMGFEVDGNILRKHSVKMDVFKN
ncbi:o-succinylbenzoate synthase [Bacillus sonorensis]|uniref:o-succinylbenzoate synthase n=2 Tax=Bacillus sonorensis TaxID=119858 RepID=M5PG83_9BACI|nr:MULTISPECIES: o-succinylbenzoate synthase [Bacillus]TWK74083.1 o-succinylbenzoate synthase [Bacillus paralicheniformis]ASB87783.1 o-succinylbenzoate synthase [Bacillus sonorensis]EME76635.1 O-succinylbenzoate synthase MenC [Bacillus sonorensis L12]MBG9915702.1 O-succinylbenzoate synthase [Bacillus sonorensis]MCF7617119.1 o-succinylbenzoate synthase [Bacillus sonorensis]